KISEEARLWRAFSFWLDHYQPFQKENSVLYIVYKITLSRLVLIGAWRKLLEYVRPALSWRQPGPSLLCAALARRAVAAVRANQCGRIGGRLRTRLPRRERDRERDGGGEFRGRSPRRRRKRPAPARQCRARRAGRHSFQYQ